MSTGVFLSIRESYVPEAQTSADSLLFAVRSKLGELGLPLVDDPERAPHVCEGRTGLDHHGSRVLRDLGTRAGEGRPHAYLLEVNPYRLVYVPRELIEPQVTEHRETLWRQEVNIPLGSSQRLLADLLDMAGDLGIPIAGGVLSDELAEKIDTMQALGPQDTDRDLIENVRAAWLLMHEASRLSIAHDVPICLAG